MAFKPWHTWSVTERLKEIDRFFQGRSAVHRTMQRLVGRLDRTGIPYAIFGGMAVNAHGHKQTTDDVEVLFTPEGFEQFRKLAQSHYEASATGRKRRFLDRANGVPVDTVLTGHCPRRGQTGPILYPDPAVAGVVIEKVRFVHLISLIELKLAMGRYRDLGDVGALIRVHDLDESFLEELHPSVHQDFIKCLEEKRREDDYIAREG